MNWIVSLVWINLLSNSFTSSYNTGNFYNNCIIKEFSESMNLVFILKKNAKFSSFKPNNLTEKLARTIEGLVTHHVPFFVVFTWIFKRNWKPEYLKLNSNDMLETTNYFLSIMNDCTTHDTITRHVVQAMVVLWFVEQGSNYEKF